MDQDIKVAISIVNFNCLQHTKNLIDDLDRQSYSNYVVYFYDQGSIEEGTPEFIKSLQTRLNYVVVQNGENKPLNHIWNEFANLAKSNFDVLTFLNNDIRIPSNYLEDTVNILKDKRMGIAIHATNNKEFRVASTPTRYIFETADIKQGWEFSLHADAWEDIPEILKFYCGDDFVFHKNYKSKKYVGVAKSSPVIHKLSQTREAMGEEFISKIKEQALLDISNYKALGFPHSWTNISKFSRLKPEFNQIIEIISDGEALDFVEYKNRLNQHLHDISDVKGHILDIGVCDIPTFNTLLENAISQDKKLIGIDLIDVFSNDITVNTSKDRPSERIKISNKFNEQRTHFDIRCNGFSKDINGLDSNISFAFIGCLTKSRIRSILPKLWDMMEPGGTIFFPYYHFNSRPEVFEVVNEFLLDKKPYYLASRIQTKSGVHDTYLAVKCFKKPIPYKKRDKPLIIASVLKTGGVYDEHYVNKLASAIKRHTTVDYKFVCLTDSTDDVIDKTLVDEVIPLEYGLPKWWSKLELFRPELFGDSQILYFDLDTLIVDNIDDFASYGGDFLALRDFNTLVGFGSGILGWNSLGGHHIFYKFVRNLLSGKITIKQFSGGDQQAIHHFLEHKTEWVQDIFPNKMAAFKYECFNEDTSEVHIPELASVICFHGNPKMGQLESDPVIKEHWK